MPFKPKIAEMIAYRAAYICSNPECNTLTIGPALNDTSLKNKKGEAAHIFGEKTGAARFSANPSIDIDSIENGLWLCANCHTLIDKNNGIDYSESQLFEWKKEHEETISVILRTHKSPIPLIYRQSKNRKIAQNIVELMCTKGVYFHSHCAEREEYATKSIIELRKAIQKEMRDIDADKRLKGIIQGIQDANREFMNELSQDHSMFHTHLEILRMKIYRQLKRLRDEIGCDIPVPISAYVN
ncbi:HNH endonuclease signature motif containing protein [Pantoea sp. CFSAN033090]|uniref:HNH endonuclease signature motif containing protein n=1 Tax=Pantoea sp. CFSAN033090 TaxID=1690502 RepID=UPI000691F25C|nr:HNH endonuclease signature motif containing protein [Pantoea sp. CFSAN033090]KOA70282.1 hypothetical protein AFL22_11335 [Pantoea sp. CFSAN033090]